jgi:DNA anti-recombination protein RmuC
MAKEPAKEPIITLDGLAKLFMSEMDGLAGKLDCLDKNLNEAEGRMNEKMCALSQKVLRVHVLVETCLSFQKNEKGQPVDNE